MEKNLQWAPELLDLLHRLISMTRCLTTLSLQDSHPLRRHEFNSCFLNLYRHG